MLRRDISALVPWLLFVATVGALVLSGYAWRRRQQPGAKWLALTVFTSALWTGLDLFNYLVAMPELQIIAKRVTWLLILVAGFAFFRFACIHARRERWWEVVRIPVTAALVVNTLLMVSNEYHHLVWPGERWVDLGFARVPWLESGPAFFWIFRPTAAGLPLAGVLALIVSAVGFPAFYLRQIAVLAAGALIPVIINLAFVSPTAPGIDLTPVAVVMVVTGFAWSTFQYGLLEVIPVARSLLLEQLDDGVVVIDAEWRVIDLNPAAERLLRPGRWTPGAAVEVIMPFWKDVKDVLGTGDAHTVEAALGGNGATVLEVSSSPIRGEQGNPLGRFIVLHDVTARAQLIRELDAYARTVARDLKGPLASLTVAVNAACEADHVLSDRSSSYLQNVARVCRQMTETVDALLRFAQLRSIDDVEVERLDMPTIVDSTLRRLSAAIDKAEAKIALPDRWPTAIGYPIWVEEIWTNYISNAIKYGGQPPRIELGASADTAPMARYWVRDNGAGLTEQQRALLFTESTRLDPQRAEGHGLGLSIVRRIAEKLGGEAGCDSTPGAGSTFWFTLPLAGSPDVRTAMAGGGAPGGRTTG